MPSCATCPSRLTPDEALVAFGKDTGVPVCAKFGHMLGKPGVSASRNEKIEEHFAQDCPEFGNPRPTSMSAPQALVAAPDPVAMMERLNNSISGLLEPTSCSRCKFYVEPRIVKDELGWTFGLCRAKGRLIFPNLLRQEAQDCPLGIVGEGQDTTAGLLEMGIYTDAFSSTDPVKTYMARKSISTIEPTTYVTDKPVSEQDQAEGIRAWRRIVSQEDSDRHIDLPVFDIASFTPHEAANIPRTGDDEHPEWYVDHDDFLYTLGALWMGPDKAPILQGQAGVGKTELARHIAWIMCVPLVRINITRSSEVDDLAGKWTLVKDGDVNVTQWQNGRVASAWTSRCVLLIDEPNVGPDEVWQMFRPLTDNSKQFALDQKDGEKLPRNPFCFPVFAMNPSWDAKYVGTNELNYADISRTGHVFVSMPPEVIERDIIIQWCEEIEDYHPATETLDKVMEIAQQIRELVAQGSLPISWNLREQIKVMQLLKFFGLRRAYRIAITDALEPETGDQIKRIVEGYA